MTENSMKKYLPLIITIIPALFLYRMIIFGEIVTANDDLARHPINEWRDKYIAENKIDAKNVLYLGNDVNDLTVIPVVDLFCSPSDSHPEVLQQSDFIFETKGGEGIVKELFQHLSKN